MKKILYINAGAGSGKTYRLTHLLPEYLNSGKVNPSEVIVTTFTKAAAAEIKLRARNVLLENSDVDNATKLETAAIGTIHSVAQMFINKYWYAIGMRPEPEVLSDADKAIYRKSSIAQLLQENNFTNERAAINAFFETFRPKHLGKNPVDHPYFWTEYLESMVGKIAYYDIKDDALAASQEESKKEVEKVFYRDEAMPSPEEFCAMRDTCLSIMEKKYEEKPLKEKKDYIDKLRKPYKFNYSSLRSFHSATKKVTKHSNKITNIYNILSILLQNKCYTKVVCDCIDALYTLAKAWLKKYDEFKRAKGVIDYDDMEKGFLKLLNIDSIASEIADTYKLVMVDEFQDCNPIQLRIFDRLSDLIGDKSPLEQSTIWVGDPKQAIYSFRGSDTDLIERVASRFPDKEGVADSNGLKKESLRTSYRSREDLINLVNDTFDRDGLFDGMVRLEKHNPECPEYEDAVMHWHIKDKNRTGDKDFRLNLARRIKRLVEKEQYFIIPKGENEPRKIKYSDIAILVRTNNEARDIAHEMRCESVPVYVPETEITDRAEVQLLLALMHLSEMGGWKENEHEWATVLRLWNGMSTEDILRERVEYMLDNDNSIAKWLSDDERVASVRIALEEVAGMSFDKKIQNLALLLRLNDKVKQWGEVEVRKQNIRTLQNAAKAFVKRCERLDIKTTTAEFIAYISEAKLEVEKNTDSETVKVVTYHGSKGLEWPMVILASLNDTKIGDNDIKSKFFGVNELQIESSADAIIPGYRLMVFPDVLGQSAPEGIISILKNEIPRFEALRASQKKDDMRLLYVGMTRAREYLVSLAQGDKGEMKWLSEELGITSSSNDIWGVGRAVKVESIEAILPLKPETKSKKTEKIAEYEAKLKEWEEKCAAMEDRHNIPLGTYQLQDIAELCDDGFNTLVKTPSKLVDDTLQASHKVITFEGVHFFPERIGKDEYALMGTCVHNVFASYNPDVCHDSNIAMAASVIKNHGFDERIDPCKVIDSIEALFSWLTKEYGEATTIEHEVPFTQKREDGTIVRGEMDLLWNTPKGTVLVDFKNFVARNSSYYLENTIPNEETGENIPNKHYIGNYFAQMKAYSDALSASNTNVTAIVIYYSIIGDAVELKFK